MWDKVPQVLSEAGRVSLPLKALKAFGLSILSLYISSAMAAGVMGSIVRDATARTGRGFVVADFTRQGALLIFILGAQVNVIL